MDQQPAAGKRRYVAARTAFCSGGMIERSI
jgi:hypothetical protein